MNKLNEVAFLMLITMALLTGCSPTKHVLKKTDPDMSQMSPRKTPVTEELSCFGDMLSTYRNLPISPREVVPVYIDSVVDKTNISTINYGNSEIPSDMKEIAINTISKIGGSVRLQNKEDGDANIVIYGALTEYDRSLQNHKMGLDANADYLSTRTRINTGTTGQSIYEDRPDTTGGINASYNELSNISRMTMDFHIVHKNDRGEINTDSVVTNTILLYQDAETKSFGVNFNGKSLGLLSTLGATGATGYNDSMTEVDARHAAIRMLIERSIMNLLGKEYKLPYWRCQMIVKKDDSGTEKPPEPKILPNAFIEYKENQFKDENHDIDSDIINLVKRFYQKDDYLHTKNGIVFFDRYENSQSNRMDTRTLQIKVDEAKANLKPISIAEKWHNKLKFGEVYEDKDFKKEWWANELNTLKSKNDDVTIERNLLNTLDNKLKNASQECQNLSYHEASFYAGEIPEYISEELNNNFYTITMTKKCLMDALSKVPKNELKTPKNETKYYRSNTDKFVHYWLNVRIGDNKRWSLSE